MASQIRDDFPPFGIRPGVTVLTNYPFTDKPKDKPYIVKEAVPDPNCESGWRVTTYETLCACCNHIYALPPLDAKWFEPARKIKGIHPV